VVAQSLAMKVSLDSRDKTRIFLNRVYLFIYFILFTGMICILSSCNEPALETTLAETVTATKSATIVPSLTPKPSETQTPSITPNPFGTPISSVKWPEEGDLTQPVDIQVNFGESLNDLPSGSYLLYKDPTTRGLHYTSLDGSHQGMLFAFDPPYSVATFRRGKITSHVIGVFELGVNTRYVIDLTRQTVMKFNPLCHEAVGSPSPNGELMAGICNERRIQLDGEIVIEIVSLENGENSHLILPFEEDKRYESNLVDWVTDECFIALVGPGEAPCLISIPELGMRCVTALEDKPILAISEDWLLVRKSEGNSRILEIFPMSCFHDKDACEPVTLELESISSTRFRWSPDGTMLALDEGNQLTSTTAKIGYYDTATWMYHEIGVFSRDYGLLDWCPDSTCMLIVGEPSYIAYLDGSIERLKFNPDHPLALIAIP
jgi:hypothetical protein